MTTLAPTSATLAEPTPERGGFPFALRGGPVRGESLDSYVHWSARQLHCSPLDITSHLELGVPTSAGYLNRDVNEDAIARTAERLDVSVDSLRATTLQRWDWLGLRPERGKRGSPLGAWQRGSGARYCPRCLIENGGRWALTWYLHWTFACTRHGVLLESVCHRCGRPPRSQKPSAYPAAASHPRGMNCGCGAAAARPTADDDVPGASLDLEDPRLGTQNRIEALLSTTPTLERIFCTAGEPVTPREWLTDLTLVTHFVMLSLIADDDRDAFTSTTATYDVEELAKPTAWRNSLAARDTRSANATVTPQVLQRELVTSSADIGACVTLADALLSSDDIEHLRSGLSWMPVHWRVQTQQRAARGQFSCSQPLADAMTGRVRQTSEGWYAALRTKHRPRPELVHDPTRYFPAALYPQVRRWVSVIRGDLKEAAVIAGLLAGRRDARRVHETACELGLAHVAADVADAWSQLNRTTAARNDIRTVASWLFMHNYQVDPIDFRARRAQLPQPTELSPKVTRDLAQALGTRHSPTLERVAALYVWERLTGSDALLTPDTLTAYGAFRVRYRHVRERWNQCLPLPLHQHLETYALPDGAVEASPIERLCPPVHPSSHWTPASHAEPHLLSARLKPLRDVDAKDLANANAARLAQAVAGAPDADAWAGIRLLWKYNQVLREAPTSWLDRARQDVSTLRTGCLTEERHVHPNRWDPLLEEVLVILRTGEVPHDCYHDRDHHGVDPMVGDVRCAAEAAP